MLCCGCSDTDVEVSGTLKQFHKLTLTFNALACSETSETYLNNRLNVTFISPNDKTYKVPGYFAADGNAAETSAKEGAKWRCHFNPDEVGVWQYEVSFKTGKNIAVSMDETAGTSISLDGFSGEFSVEASDKMGNDFRAKGKLRYVNTPTAQFSNGEYYFEIGTDSPETFLEYEDFDATVGRHDFAEVASNYHIGDPSWQNGKGTEIIGAVNYLANNGLNIHYMCIMNITGDGKEVFPFPTKTDFTTYDVSKLHQWQIVFDHMYTKGIALEFVLTEDENSNWFEDVEGIDKHQFAISRKLYYREIIARFGYLNIIYNIGEEANWEHAEDFYTPKQIEDAAAYIQNVSPYSDLVSIHNGPSNDFSLFENLESLSDISSLTSISFQGNSWDFTHGYNEILNLKQLSKRNNFNWVVRYSEPYANKLPDLELWTSHALWASITAGSVGTHYYSHNGDVNSDNYKGWESYYQRMGFAKDFFETNDIPFWTMENHNIKVNDTTGTVLSDAALNYIVLFLKNGGTTNLNLPDDNTYTIKWFDPRNGGALQNGTIKLLQSANKTSLGYAPHDADKSWVVLLTKN